MHLTWFETGINLWLFFWSKSFFFGLMDLQVLRSGIIFNISIRASIILFFFFIFSSRLINNCRGLNRVQMLMSKSLVVHAYVCCHSSPLLNGRLHLWMAIVLVDTCSWGWTCCQGGNHQRITIKVVSLLPDAALFDILRGHDFGSGKSVIRQIFHLCNILFLNLGRRCNNRHCQVRKMHCLLSQEQTDWVKGCCKFSLFQIKLLAIFGLC